MTRTILREHIIGTEIALNPAILRGNVPADLLCNLTHRDLGIQYILNRSRFTQNYLFVRYLAFSLLFSKIGNLSQPSLECAWLKGLLQPSRNVTGFAKQECH